MNKNNQPYPKAPIPDPCGGRFARNQEEKLMGTRSMTIVMQGNRELVRFYRQFDGYPEGHGLDLARLCNKDIVNGFSSDHEKHTVHTVPIANGTDDLAAQIIAVLKSENPIGGLYLEPIEDEVSDWIEYVYIVRGPTTGQTGRVTIECTTQTGPFPFNIQAEDTLVFPPTDPAEIIARYAEPTDADAGSASVN